MQKIFNGSDIIIPHSVHDLLAVKAENLDSLIYAGGTTLITGAGISGLTADG